MQPVSIEELQAIAERAYESGQLPLAGLMFALSSAESADFTEELLRHIQPFLKRKLNELQEEKTFLEEIT